jgi:hypothetical protein
MHAISPHQRRAALRPLFLRQRARRRRLTTSIASPRRGSPRHADGAADVERIRAAHAATKGVQLVVPVTARKDPVPGRRPPP